MWKNKRDLEREKARESLLQFEICNGCEKPQELPVKSCKAWPIFARLIYMCRMLHGAQVY